MLLEPSPSQFDLRWRMFGIDVRVHPMFWLVSVIMGWSTIELGPQYMLIWVGCVFVSILIHELGHVWMGQILGSYGHIVLYSFGGLAIGSNHLHRRWQRIAVCFAGPLAGFVFLAVMLLALWIWDPAVFPFYASIVPFQLGLPLEWFGERPMVPQIPGEMMLFVINQLIFINLMWGLVNLLPVWPLDGGQISRDVCEGLSPASGLTHSLGISLVVAGLLAVHCFMVHSGRRLLPLSFGGLYAGILFALLAWQSFQMLQQAKSHRRDMDDHWDY